MAPVLFFACAADDAGQPCGSDEDCQHDCFNHHLFSGNGLCTNHCGEGHFGICAEDFECVVVEGDSWCLPECTTFDDTCRERYGQAWECEEFPLEDGGGLTEICID